MYIIPSRIYQKHDFQRMRDLRGKIQSFLSRTSELRILRLRRVPQMLPDLYSQ